MLNRLGGALTIALLVGVVLTAGCGGSKPYPTSTRDNFLSACESSPKATPSACECALSKIEDKVPFEQFARDETAVLEGGSLPKTYTSALLDCAADEPKLRPGLLLYKSYAECMQAENDDNYCRE
jgi:hypothetical protein